MKLATLLLSLVIASFSLAQQWQAMNDYPGNRRDDGTVFTIGNKVYCGLGMNAWFGYNSDFHVFDLDTETWASGTDLPAGEARQYANGFAHGGSGYVFGGIDANGNYLNDLWKFDPSGNQWTAETDLPSTGRAGAVCFVIQDTVYVVGGKSATVNALDEVWAYDLVNHVWSQKADFDLGIWRGVAFSWNEKGIVGLGKNAQDDLSGQFYSYDLQLNDWTLISGVTMEATSYAAATQIGNLAFLYGGMNASGSYLNTFTRINLETLEMHVLTDFPADARRGGMAFAGNDEFYITTGVSSTARLDETWKAGYILSQEEIDMEMVQINVFPNPSAGKLSIRSPKQIMRISICELSGKTIFRETLDGSSIELEPNLPAGMYLMKVEGEHFISTVKVSFL